MRLAWQLMSMFVYTRVIQKSYVPITMNNFKIKLTLEHERVPVHVARVHALVIKSNTFKKSFDTLEAELFEPHVQ